MKQAVTLIGRRVKKEIAITSPTLEELYQVFTYL